jgi:hypothetical protein
MMECLATDPSERPATGAVLSRRLAETVAADAWTLDAARTWWESCLARSRFLPKHLHHGQHRSEGDPHIAAAWLQRCDNVPPV